MARLTFRIKWWNFTFIPCDTNVRRGTWLTSVFSRTTALRQKRSFVRVALAIRQPTLG